MPIFLEVINFLGPRFVDMLHILVHSLHIINNSLFSWVRSIDRVSYLIWWLVSMVVLIFADQISLILIPNFFWMMFRFSRKFISGLIYWCKARLGERYTNQVCNFPIETIGHSKPDSQSTTSAFTFRLKKAFSVKMCLKTGTLISYRNIFSVPSRAWTLNQYDG